MPEITTATATPHVATADSIATDSIATDSLAAVPKPVIITRLPWSDTCHEADAPHSEADSLYTTGIVANWVVGREGQPRPIRPGYNSGVLTLIIVSFLIVAMGVRRGARLWKALTHDLVNMRRRSNAFDERTIGETWVVGALILQSCIYIGLLLYSHLRMVNVIAPDAPVFTTVAIMTLTVICLYIFRLTAYWVTGYAFSDAIGRTQWIRGFNASQVFLGVMLIIPALVAMFYPAYAINMLWLSVCAYLVAEIAFIRKGFMIFYCRFAYLFYFILYLCALEIIPLILTYLGAVRLYRLII